MSRDYRRAEKLESDLMFALVEILPKGTDVNKLKDALIELIDFKIEESAEDTMDRIKERGIYSRGY